MFHTKNRERLCEVAEGGLIILAAYDAVQQSGDMAAPFLQQSSFWWLTGIEEPGWKLILDTPRKQATLVRPERTHIDIIFNGEANDEEIIQTSGIANIISEKEFEAELRQLKRRHTVVKMIDPKHDTYDFVSNPALHNLSSILKRVFTSVQDCSGIINVLRAKKQPEELQRMRKAIELTCQAFNDVREQLVAYKSEAEIEAEFIYRFHRAGAKHAYEPIVASGKNACTLHYVANSDSTHARQMVLIDIGARVDGYCADITRTYCRNPTKRQQAVHRAVEQAHAEIIALIKPGLPVADYIRQVDDIMKRALHSIGLLDDMSDDTRYRQYFPHAVSHGLGVDTHDSLGRPRYFEEGMVLTVEPGIYIQEEHIGVRIEDDILVTKTGHENLSASLSTSL